jgi:hypothetical protein
MPGQAVILADHAVYGAGKDDRNGRVGHDCTLPRTLAFAKPMRDKEA